MSALTQNSFPEPSDATLLERVGLREPEALLALYRRYKIPIFSLILRITGDRPAAEEILQDTFHRLWEAHHRFDGSQGPLLSWLFTVARNLALDYKRKTSRRGAFLVHPSGKASAATGDWSSNAATFFNPELSLSIAKALEELPLEQRSAIELAYFEGLSHSELAKALDTSLGTVKSRIRLGLSKLREALKSCRVVL